MMPPDILNYYIARTHGLQLTHEEACKLTHDLTGEDVQGYAVHAASVPVTVEWILSLSTLLYEYLKVAHVVEICAGHGIVAHALHEMGWSLTTTDIKKGAAWVTEKDWRATVEEYKGLDNHVILAIWPIIDVPGATNLPDALFELDPDATLVLYAPRTKTYLGSWLGKEQLATDLVEGFQDPPVWQPGTKPLPPWYAGAYEWATTCTMVLNRKEPKV